MDFQAIRKEYENAGLDESTLTDAPRPLFEQWYQLAVEKCPGPWFEPNVMSLATCDLAGNVSNRYVLMKQIDDTGIQFFTNYGSDKGEHLKANPCASIAFHWPYLGRQVRVSGNVSKTTREVSEAYFHSRPRGSQIGACASQQSAVVGSRHELDAKRKELVAQYEGQTIPLPENWGGYLIAPQRFEFWQGRLDRMHDRIVYELRDGSWNRFRISP